MNLVAGLENDLWEVAVGTGAAARGIGLFSRVPDIAFVSAYKLFQGYINEVLLYASIVSIIFKACVKIDQVFFIHQ